MLYGILIALGGFTVGWLARNWAIAWDWYRERKLWDAMDNEAAESWVADRSSVFADDEGLAVADFPLGPNYPWDLRLADALSSCLMGRHAEQHGGVQKSFSAEGFTNGVGCLCRWCKARRLLAERFAPGEPGMSYQSGGSGDEIEVGE